MEKEKKKLSKSQKIMIIINSVAVLLIIGIILFFCIYYKDTLKLLASEEGKKEFVEKLENTGFWGVLLLIAIQILQVIVAFIPGEVVELAAGAMFGPIWGTILCLIGLNLATIIIYYLVKL